MLYKKCNSSRRRELRRTVPELTYSFAAVGHQLPVLSGAFDFVVLASTINVAFLALGRNTKNFYVIMSNVYWEYGAPLEALVKA